MTGVGRDVTGVMAKALADRAEQAETAHGRLLDFLDGLEVTRPEKHSEPEALTACSDALDAAARALRDAAGYAGGLERELVGVVEAQKATEASRDAYAEAERGHEEARRRLEELEAEGHALRGRVAELEAALLALDGRRFTVTGAGPFPVDMLRRDACWPQGRDDAAAILGDTDLGNGTRTITLLSWNSHAPMAERWASFGWTAGDVVRGAGAEEPGEAG